MTRFLLALFAVKFFNPRQRRALVLGSFYSMLRPNLTCEEKMSELNQNLELANDTRGLFLAAELPHILWDKKKCSDLRQLPPEKLKEYYRELLPTWLHYDFEENGFDIESDLSKVMSIFNHTHVVR